MDGERTDRASARRLSRGTVSIGHVVLLRRRHPFAKTAALIDRNRPRRFEIGPLTCCCLSALLDALGVVILPQRLVDEIIRAYEEMDAQRSRPDV